MKSSVILAALAASLAAAEPEAYAAPEPLPAPQRQLGAILGMMAAANAASSMAGKGKSGAKGGSPKTKLCSCPAERTTSPYCKNNNEAGPPWAMRGNI
jgi:hypothetical protein